MDEEYNEWLDQQRYYQEMVASEEEIINNKGENNE
tara:strand:- start:1219 stop:1323 length:105 start_codon:yes stop_codon:yes gene_type:complete